MIEVNDREIIENPNLENDIYTDYERYSGKLAAFFVYMMQIIFTIACLWLAEVCLRNTIKGDDFRVITFLYGILCLYGGIQSFKAIGYETWKEKRRKQTIARGEKYPGLIIKNDRVQESGFRGHTVIRYKLTIKYRDTTYQMERADWNPALVLENPYCDVYEYEGQIVVTNFGVRKEYIKESKQILDYAKAKAATRDGGYEQKEENEIKLHGKIKKLNYHYCRPYGGVERYKHTIQLYNWSKFIIGLVVYYAVLWKYKMYVLSGSYVQEKIW